MKRNSVYVAFILGGALLGERVGQGLEIERAMHWLTIRAVQFSSLHTNALFTHLHSHDVQAVDYGFNTMWERNNQGVRH